MTDSKSKKDSKIITLRIAKDVHAAAKRRLSDKEGGFQSLLSAYLTVWAAGLDWDDDSPPISEAARSARAVRREAERQRDSLSTEGAKSALLTMQREILYLVRNLVVHAKIPLDYEDSPDVYIGKEHLLQAKHHNEANGEITRDNIPLELEMALSHIGLDEHRSELAGQFIAKLRDPSLPERFDETIRKIIDDKIQWQSSIVVLLHGLNEKQTDLAERFVAIMQDPKLPEDRLDALATTLYTHNPSPPMRPLAEQDKSSKPSTKRKTKAS